MHRGLSRNRSSFSISIRDNIYVYFESIQSWIERYIYIYRFEIFSCALKMRRKEKEGSFLSSRRAMLAILEKKRKKK